MHIFYFLSHLLCLKGHQNLQIHSSSSQLLTIIRHTGKNSLILEGVRGGLSCLSLKTWLPCTCGRKYTGTFLKWEESADLILGGFQPTRTIAMKSVHGASLLAWVPDLSHRMLPWAMHSNAFPMVACDERGTQSTSLHRPIQSFGKLVNLTSDNCSGQQSR